MWTSVPRRETEMLRDLFLQGQALAKSLEQERLAKLEALPTRKMFSALHQLHQYRTLFRRSRRCGCVLFRIVLSDSGTEEARRESLMPCTFCLRIQQLQGVSEESPPKAAHLMLVLMRRNLLRNCRSTWPLQRLSRCSDGLNEPV